MGGYPTCAVRRFDPFIGLSAHEALILPAPAPAPMPHLSFGIVSGITQLFAQPSDCKHADVLADGIHLMGRLSDAFPIVPHLTIGAGYQPILPFTILFGSSTTCWGSGKVVLKTSNPIFGNSDADIASHLAFILSPHLACNETFSLPYDIAIGTNSTCQVGFSWGDLAACLIDIAIQLALEVVMKGIGDAFTAATRKFKASGLAKKLSKARALAKESDEALTKCAKDVGSLTAARQTLKDLSDAGSISDDVFNKLDDAAQAELDTAFKNMDELLETSKQATKDLPETKMSEKATKISELLDEQSSYMEKYMKGEITESAYNNARKSIDTELARTKKAYQKALDQMCDATDSSWSSIWQRVKLKEEAKKVDVTSGRSKYMNWKDYAVLYGTPSSGVMSDPKTYVTLGLYPVYKFTTAAGDEFFQTLAWQSGHTYLYAVALRGKAGLKKLASRLYRAHSGNYSSEDKGGARFGNYWGFSREDLIDTINGVSSSDDASYADESSTTRFDWVGDGAVSKSTTTSKFGWTTKAEESARDDHWSDTSYIAGTTDRFGWVDDLEESESSTT